MRVALRVHQLASAFWSRVGATEAFPRSLESAIEGHFPVSVKRVPGLSLRTARQWLEPLGIVAEAGAERLLCGCLAEARGGALLLVDADDPPDEQRFTLAHELAHFLRDFWQPRQRVRRVLGAAALEADEGRRRLSHDERFAAALEGIVTGVRVHLLPRGPDGMPTTRACAAAEEYADELAFELLAPAAHLDEAGASGWTEAELTGRLVHVYGLPRAAALRYVSQLRPPCPKPTAWLQALRARR